MIFGLAAQMGWKLYQLDVRSTFLQGELDEDVFLDQPQGYLVKGMEQQVYKLHKTLYGLKQVPRTWYSKIESHFIKEGFQKCSSEQTLFTKRNAEGRIIIISIYVDDLIYIGNDERLIVEFKSSMLSRFDMTNLGIMSYFLGIEVIQNGNGIFIGQKQYAKDILKRFGMENCNSICNPIAPGAKIDKDTDGDAVDDTLFKQIVDSLMYLTATRPDLMYVTSLISRYVARPTKIHMKVAKRALRYLKGTTQLGIYYQKTAEMKGELTAYTDNDYAGDIDDRRSTSGYVFLLSLGSIAWSSKKQPIVTLSTIEAEFVLSSSVDEKNTGRTWMEKSEVHTHKVEGKIVLEHCGNGDQVADIMIKPLKLEAFLKLRNMLGMQDITEIN
ncbi:transmembrane signal receptor [Lithospermum erythrorhizon]|uniref:Transmembrane signal receptor n=1 Tax=Lithospermum erythrorhizon TaxID=34254 RepID=A0AAV3RVQ2_LITER